MALPHGMKCGAAAMLLMHIQDEEKVFWCMIYILNRRNWRSIYIEDMPRLMELMDIVEERLQTEYAELAEHLEMNGLTTAAAFSRLFLKSISKGEQVRRRPFIEAPNHLASAFVAP